MPHSFVVIKSVAVLGIYALSLASGYQRRKPVWTRGSWIRFGQYLAAGAVSLLLGVVMCLDPVRQAAGQAGGSVLLAFGIIFVASGFFALLILTLWFARGRPDHQLG